MTTKTRGGVSERAVNRQMGEMTVTVVTDPRTQIPAHRRYIVGFVGGVACVADRWEEHPRELFPLGAAWAAQRAAVLNGRAVPMDEGGLAALATSVFGGEQS